MNLSNLKIDKEWTLFLDRDGVINERIVSGYVTCWDEFVLLDGVEEALAAFADLFGRIIVVSNQQGVGKGLMSMEQVETIHEILLDRIQKSGGRIDAIYFSPHLESEQSNMRKPEPGMALQAQQDFPDISFNLSLMAGDTLSDMKFGHGLGMKTAMITRDEDELKEASGIADYSFPDLLTFATQLQQIK